MLQKIRKIDDFIGYQQDFMPLDAKRQRSDSLDSTDEVFDMEMEESPEIEQRTVYLTKYQQMTYIEILFRAHVINCRFKAMEEIQNFNVKVNDLYDHNLARLFKPGTYVFQYKDYPEVAVTLQDARFQS